MLNLYTDSSWYTGIKITVDREIYQSTISLQLYFKIVYFVWNLYQNTFWYYVFMIRFAKLVYILDCNVNQARVNSTE